MQPKNRGRVIRAPAPAAGAGFAPGADAERVKAAAAAARPSAAGPAIYHDACLEKHAAEARKKEDILRPVLAAARALAETYGMALSTVYRQLDAHRQNGVAGLAKRQRKDVGMARAMISLAFDREAPFSAEVLAGLRAELDGYIRSHYAHGTNGWRQIQVLAGMRLMELCHAWGWPAMSAKADARRRQNWKSADGRPMCGNCRKGEVTYADRYIETPSYKCLLGGFGTVKSAICDCYEAPQYR
ncbi:MAG: hypothetical protein ACKN9T_14325 [Candidatus Methylumidiphilus sp.]